MPVKELEDLRKTLRSTVRGAWAKPEMMDAQDALSKAARDSGFAACLRELMASGSAGRDAYRECAKKAGLAEAYRELWGKK